MMVSGTRTWMTRPPWPSTASGFTWAPMTTAGARDARYGPTTAPTGCRRWEGATPVRPPPLDSGTRKTAPPSPWLYTAPNCSWGPAIPREARDVRCGSTTAPTGPPSPPGASGTPVISWPNHWSPTAWTSTSGPTTRPPAARCGVSTAATGPRRIPTASGMRTTPWLPAWPSRGVPFTPAPTT